MSQTGKFSRAPSSRSSPGRRSLGIISENNSFDDFADADFEDGPKPFTKEELFENDLSMIDSVSTPGGTAASVYIDLEAEERAFVTGSQQYLDAVETIRQLKERLIRRTAIIDEIRKYYLRDVVTVKHIMKDVLAKHEREEVLAMYEQNLPSINLNEALRLHAPVKSELQVAQCGECGGHLEIVMKDSDEVDKLKKIIVDVKDRESRFRIKLATLDAQIEATTREKAEAAKSHAEEKRFLYAEMKKVKAQVEKVQSEMSAVNKVNKRCQAENETFRAQLSALQHASTQLAQGQQEIESLRSEVSELTSALKSARLSDRTAQRDLADKVLELTNVSLRAEEQSELLKSLRREKEELTSEVSALRQEQREGAAKAAESAEQLRAQSERIAELEGQLAEATEEQDRLAALVDSSDGDLRQELLNTEDECAELRTVNKSQTRDLERVKRQLEKVQEARLVLEHDLAVARHENTQREEELLSLQHFIQARAARSVSFSSSEGEPPLKIEEVLRSIQAEARSKVGEGPTMSAKVASAKLQQSQEQGQGEGQGVGAEEARDEEDGEYGNFDQEDEQTETDASETKASALKKKKSRRAKNVISAASTMAKGAKARRGSFGDKAGLKDVVTAAAAAAGASGPNSPTKSPAPRSKSPKKAARQRTSRRSFDFSGGVPLSADSGDREGEEVTAAEEDDHGSDHDTQTQGREDTDTDVSSAARAAASAAGGKKSKSPKKGAKRVKRKSFDGGIPRPTTPGIAEAGEGHTSDPDQEQEQDQDDAEDHDDHGDQEEAEGEEGEEGTEDGAGDSPARRTPTKKKRAAAKSGAAGKPPKGTKKPSKAPSVDSTPASTPIKPKRSTVNVKSAAKADKVEGKKEKSTAPEKGKAKRRKSFGGGEGQDSNPSSRPVTRGSDGEDSKRASVDNEDEGEADEAVADTVVAVKKGRSSRPLEPDVDAEQAQADEEGDGEDGDPDGDGEVTEEQTEAGDASEGGSKPSTARRGAPSAKVAKGGKSVKQSAVSRKASTRSNTAESLNPDTDGDGDRPGSRESSRSRSASPSKKGTTSRDIKREAMEKERSARASMKQKSVKAVAPSLDGVQRDRKAKPPLPKRNDGSRRSVSRGKPGSAGSDLGAGGLDGQEDGEYGLETGDNTASNTEFNSENNSDAEEEEEVEGYEEGEGAEEHSWEGQDGASGEDEEGEEEENEGELEGVQEEEERLEEEHEAPKKAETPTKGRKEKAVTKQAKQPDRATKTPTEAKPKSARSDVVGFDATPPEPRAVVHLPLPKRRRSLPKNYSFSASSLTDLLRTASNDSLGSVGRFASPTKATSTASTSPHAASPAPGTTATITAATATLTTATGAVAASPMAADRKAKLQEEFAAGLHRVPDPPSIQDDDDLRDRSHVKYVPIIPIEVKRYVTADPAQPSVKKKFTLPTEEKIELEPLAEGHTPFEAQLRKDLLRVLTAYKGMAPNEMNRALNAAKPVLHAMCKTYTDTLDTTWAALRANRTALDLHYVMKNIIEGMAPCVDAKSGTVELAEAVKKLLPIASLNLAGPAATAKWQEEVQLNTSLFNNLLPKVDPTTGKIASNTVDEFFNPKPLDPNNRTATAYAVLQEKAQVAERAAYQMQSYATDCAKVITEKLTPILKDWAKAKNVVYELDAKILAEKEKVRKALEVRIADLTKDKLLLNSTLKKTEERVKALEHTEQDLVTCQFDLKKTQGEVERKMQAIEELEVTIKELNDEIYERKRKEADFKDQVSQLVGQRGALEREKEVLNQAVAQGVADLSANKEVLKEVTEERDHFQAQYERMLMLEDRRLNKLSTVAMQCEPAVQDLAIQTEFVAPPMNLRTMVASKNARGKKASLVLSQSLEIAPSDPAALTSQMIDTASSTFHPLSPAGTVRVAHGTGTITPGSAADVAGLGSLQYGSPPSSQQGTLRSLPQLGLSDRSSLSVETTGALGTARVTSRGPTSAGMTRGASREDSFFNISAADYLAAAPINYELSSHRLAGPDTFNEMARSLGGDDGSVGSIRSINSKFTKKKALKVNRGGQQAAGGNLGHYQYVHSEDKIPDWGTVHGPVGGSRVDPHVVLGISGVNSIGGHTARPSGLKGELAGSTASASGTLTAAGNAILRGAGVSSSSLAPSMQHPQHGGKPGLRGLEIEVGLPEVKVQSYQTHSQKAGYGGGGGGQYARQQALYGVNDAQYPHSGPNSRGSHTNSTSGLGPTSSADALQLMLDSPSFAGNVHTSHSGFDFERDRRKHIARIAADLPPGQEMVNGIVYNHRSGHGGGATYTSSVVTDTTGEGAGLLHSASQGSVATHSLAGRGTNSHGQGNGHGKQAPQPGGLTGISEDMLKRLPVVVSTIAAGDAGMAEENENHNKSSDMSTKREPPSILKVFPYSTLGILVLLLAVNREMVSDMLQVSAQYWEVDRWVVIVASIVSVVVLMMIVQGIWALYYQYLNHQVAVKEARELYEKERNALIALFNALDGKRWKDKTRWCSDEPIEKWKGVKLDRVTGRVNKLLLAENELAGYIPEEIGDLEHLKEIDFRLNNIRGTIPKALSSLQRLEGLYLFDNFIEGKIPLELSRLPHLSGVYLYNNCFENVPEAVEEFHKNAQESCIIYI